MKLIPAAARRIAAVASLAVGAIAAGPQAQAETLDTALGQRAEVGQFAAAVRASKVGASLAGKARVTVFAPSDTALKALPNDLWARLQQPANKAQLEAFLANHVVKGDYPSSRLVAPKTDRFSIDSLGGGIVIDKSKALKANDVALYHLDVKADNGTLHILEGAFVPRAVAKALGTPAPAASAKTAVAPVAAGTAKPSATPAAAKAKPSPARKKAVAKRPRKVARKANG